VLLEEDDVPQLQPPTLLEESEEDDEEVPQLHPPMLDDELETPPIELLELIHGS
jgi:hypothetical protein